MHLHQESTWDIVEDDLAVMEDQVVVVGVTVIVTIIGMIIGILTVTALLVVLQIVTGIIMEETAGIGVNAEALCPLEAAVVDIPLNIGDEEVTRAALPEAAAQGEADTMIYLRLPFLPLTESILDGEAGSVSRPIHPSSVCLCSEAECIGVGRKNQEMKSIVADSSTRLVSSNIPSFTKTSKQDLHSIAQKPPCQVCFVSPDFFFL